MAKGLGRGLSTLISRSTKSQEDQQSFEGLSNFKQIGINLLSPGKFQPRTYFKEEDLDELAVSIKKNGVVQPIITRKTSKDLYEIVAGERRWRAAKISGLATVPIIVMELDDRQALEIALIENIQRQNLTILEEAEGYQRLISEFEYTQEQLSNVIGKSRSQITNTLRLLALPDEVKLFLNEEKITGGHARALLTANNPIDVANKVIKSGMSVRQTEKFVKKMTEFPRERKKKTEATHEKDPEIIQLEKDISKKAGFEIVITNDDESGKVIVSYNSLANLDIILRRLEQAI